MQKLFRFMLAFFLLLPCAAHAGEVLHLTFDDPGDPFADSSPAGHIILTGTFSEGPVTGAGVGWSDAAPSPAGGGHAVFDGGSYLQLPASHDFHFASGEDFTLRFWFRSPGIDRGEGFGDYRQREHPLGFGSIVDNDSGTNLDVNLDDSNSGGRGLWTYWNGGGSNHLRTAAGTVGLYTDDGWYHYWMVRWQGRLALYVGHPDGSYDLLGATDEPGAMGDPYGPNYLGRGTAFQWYSFGFLGDLDDVEVLSHAEYPVELCPWTGLH